MKDAIELFSRLGERLRGFGNDSATLEVIHRTCDQTPWFTPAEVQRAVGAIVRDMLQPDKLCAWLDRYPTPVATPRRVLVVMAGNLPLVGFFDLLCVVASGHRCLVKPSSKDTTLMEYVVAELRAIDPDVALAFYDGQESVDAVIATGSDNANRYFRAHYAGIPALLRGSRQSVAVLSGHENVKQLAGLADDIWAYSGLGCRGVSLIFVPEGYEVLLNIIPVNSKYRNNYLQNRALLAMTGQPYRDLGAAVMVEQRAFPSVLSQIAVTRYNSLVEVEAWLAENDEEVQCVVSECVAHSRRVSFGCAQSPALTDYPDARDVLAFLTALN